MRSSIMHASIPAFIFATIESRLFFRKSFVSSTVSPVPFLPTYTGFIDIKHAFAQFHEPVIVFHPFPIERSFTVWNMGIIPFQIFFASQSATWSDWSASPHFPAMWWICSCMDIVEFLLPQRFSRHFCVYGTRCARTPHSDHSMNRALVLKYPSSLAMLPIEEPLMQTDT